MFAGTARENSFCRFLTTAVPIFYSPTPTCVFCWYTTKQHLSNELATLCINSSEVFIFFKKRASHLYAERRACPWSSSCDYSAACAATHSFTKPMSSFSSSHFRLVSSFHSSRPPLLPPGTRISRSIIANFYNIVKEILPFHVVRS